MNICRHTWWGEKAILKLGQCCSVPSRRNVCEMIVGAKCFCESSTIKITSLTCFPCLVLSAFVLFWTWRIQQNQQVWSQAAEGHLKEFWSHNVQTNIDLDEPTSANVLQRVVQALEIYCGFWNCSHCNLLNIPNENDVNTLDIAKAEHESGSSVGTHRYTRGNTHGSHDPWIRVTCGHRSSRIRVWIL